MAANATKDFDWAVKNGDLPRVKEIVEKSGVDVSKFKDANLRGPAHWAADYVCSFH